MVIFSNFWILNVDYHESKSLMEAKVLVEPLYFQGFLRLRSILGSHSEDLKMISSGLWKGKEKNNHCKMHPGYIL